VLLEQLPQLVEALVPEHVLAAEPLASGARCDLDQPGLAVLQLADHRKHALSRIGELGELFLGRTEFEAGELDRVLVGEGADLGLGLLDALIGSGQDVRPGVVAACSTFARSLAASVFGFGWPSDPNCSGSRRASFRRSASILVLLWPKARACSRRLSRSCLAASSPCSADRSSASGSVRCFVVDVATGPTSPSSSAP
jgi:hypothetical protein